MNNSEFWGNSTNHMLLILLVISFDQLELLNNPRVCYFHNMPVNHKNRKHLQNNNKNNSFPVFKYRMQNLDISIYPISCAFWPPNFYPAHKPLKYRCKILIFL